MIFTPIRPNFAGSILAEPQIIEKNTTGTTIIFSNRINTSPKNFVYATYGCTALGKKPSTIPVIAPSISAPRIRLNKLESRYRFSTFFFIIEPHLITAGSL